jgi:hypothetical protein
MTEDQTHRLASAKEMTMVFDLRELGGLIELSCEDRLKPPPAGIYVNTQVEPVLVLGKTYYEIVDGRSKPLVDPTDARGAVYNDEGKRLITAAQMKNRAVTLSTTPLIPYRGIKIAKLLYEHQIDNHVQWRKRSSNRMDHIASHFLDGIDSETVTRNMHEFLMLVWSNLYPMLADHEWHVYTTMQNACSLRVERGEDYRVAYFMEKLAAGEIKL